MYSISDAATEGEKQFVFKFFAHWGYVHVNYIPVYFFHSSFGRLRLGTFKAWDVLGLGAFYSLGRFIIGTFFIEDFLYLRRFEAWAVLYSDSGAFCSWDALYMGRFILGLFFRCTGWAEDKEIVALN
jgi:hypothetical protein